MLSNSRKPLILLIVVTLACAFLFAVFFSERPSSTFDEKYQSISIKGEDVHALIADTSEKRALGLGGRQELNTNEGMLFVFEKPDLYSFWMKDMQFPIDIMWIDARGRIVYTQEKVATSTFPTSFAPMNPALYVLELSSGYVETHHIKVGDEVIFNQ